MNDYGYLFNQQELNVTNKVKGKSIIQNTKHEMLLLDRFKELKSVMPDKIENNSTIHLISSDNFGSIELLKYFIEKYNIIELLITTWSYNNEFVQIIKNLNTDISIFIDKSMRTRKAALYNQIAELAVTGKIQMRVHHMIHSKITLIKTENHYITIEASANYSENQRIENYTITENNELFMFHKKWMSELIGK